MATKPHRGSTGVIGLTKRDFDRALFLETYADLDTRVSPSTKPYRVLRSSLLLRQLLVDGLAARVAKEHSLGAPVFRFRRLAIPKELLDDDGAHGLLPSALDPEVLSANETSTAAAYTIGSAGRSRGDIAWFITWAQWLGQVFDESMSPIVEGSSGKFLGAQLGALGDGYAIRVGDLINYVGYCMGGIHVDDADKPYKRSVSVLVGGALTRTGRSVQKDQLLSTLQVVALIALRGLSPLARSLGGRRRLLSWEPGRG